MEPGKIILPHVGPYDGLLRYQLALEIPTIGKTFPKKHKVSPNEKGPNRKSPGGFFEFTNKISKSSNHLASLTTPIRKLPSGKSAESFTNYEIRPYAVEANTTTDRNPMVKNTEQNHPSYKPNEIDHHEIDHHEIDHHEIDHHKIDHHEIDHHEIDHHEIDHHEIDHHEIELSHVPQYSICSSITKDEDSNVLFHEIISDEPELLIENNRIGKNECYLHVGGERYEWTEGEGVLFDEANLHGAVNTSSDRRIVLLIDIERPYSLPPFRLLNKMIIWGMGMITSIIS
jgi:hypothetical protein